MTWNEEPIWKGGHENKGTSTRLYDMETSHIRNCVKALQTGRIANTKSAFNQTWIQIMTEELKAREGEDYLWRGKPINEILDARALRRLVLGLPPMLPRVPPIPTNKFDEPKRSLFDEENQGDTEGA